jgi:hypothetical protein
MWSLAVSLFNAAMGCFHYADGMAFILNVPRRATMEVTAVLSSLPHCINPTVQAEVAKLWTLIDLVPGVNESGNDNREAIEAQLSVLSDALTLAETTVEFDDGFTEAYVVGAALIAVDWLWKGGSHLQ